MQGKKSRKAKPQKVPVSVAVLIPCGDTWVAGFGYDLALCMAHTSAAIIPHGGDLSVQMIQSSLLPSSRMELVKRAISVGATHLMWFDSDMRFPKDTILRLLKHEKPMVGANYVQRAVPPKPVSFKSIDWANRDGDNRTRCYTESTSTGLEQVDAVGFGCVMVRREVIAAIEPPGFEITYGNPLNGWTGEDVMFCKRVKEAGIPIYVDHDLSQEVGHMGMFRYRHEHVMDKPESRILTPDEALSDHLTLVP